MASVNLAAYFERIGHAGSIAPNLATLESLHLLHTLAIPFENLDVLLGDPIRLDQPSLEQKLLYDGRGGYCLEHNALLLNVLRELEFTAHGLAARVLWDAPDGAGSSPSHMLLAVDLAGITYLVDAGFGGMAPTAPLKLRPGVEQATAHGSYRVAGENPEFRLEAQVENEWRALYSFTLDPVEPEAFQSMNLAISGDHQGRFRTQLLAALVLADGRVALLNDRLTVYRSGGAIDERQLLSLTEVKAALEDSFGIRLPAAERLDPALLRILPDLAA